VTPFADAVAGEAPVALSEWAHEQGPVRCTRCRGFFNAFVRLRGNKWDCNLCGGQNQASDEYMTFCSNLAGRAPAEARCGSVEYLVGGAYAAAPAGRAKEGVLPDFVFLIDTSASALRSGLFSYAMCVCGGRCSGCARRGAGGLTAGMDAGTCWRRCRGEASSRAARGRAWAWSHSTRTA
jgi:hypothetical protein